MKGWSDERMIRSLRWLVGVLVAVGLLAVPVALSLISTESVSPVAPAGVDLEGVAAADEGRRVFLRDCSWCHGPDGEGTENAPSLEEAGAQGADFYLSTGRMPLAEPDAEVERGPAAYSRQTIEELVEYVAELGTGPAVPEVAGGDPFAGRRLFLSNCAACHSSSGTGVIAGDDEVAPELWPTHDRQVGEAIRIGPGQMPPFPGSHLDEQEVADIVAYVDTLGEGQAVGATDLDQYGPIGEGLFVWLVVIPLLLVVIRLLGKKAPPR